MDEGEKRPLLSQDARDQEPARTRSSPLTPIPPGPAPWEDQARGEGLGGVLAHSLPCLKGLIFLSNFLFSLLSLLALAVGLWGLAVKGSLRTRWGGPLPADPMLGLVLGGLAVSVVSLAGCLGALCENTFLLRCFSGGVLAFLVLEAMAGALLVALWGRLQDGLEHILRVAITHYQDSPDLCFLIDQVQLGLQCCGAASYQDWQRNLPAAFLPPAASTPGKMEPPSTTSVVSGCWAWTRTRPREWCTCRAVAPHSASGCAATSGPRANMPSWLWWSRGQSSCWPSSWCGPWLSTRGQLGGRARPLDPQARYPTLCQMGPRLTGGWDERPGHWNGVWGCRPPCPSRGRCQSKLPGH
ncbi:tetraspanin-10 isoform X2 [Vicugna pacos]|uniref:Tetraspanin-10 isoform X2 n=1 Tax=Vicugna pacos TaxID=30538 RepID=A0ABM5BIF7_VICPA